MGKKQKRDQAKRPAKPADPGDLRNVESWARRAGAGDAEAQQALLMLGRDASWLVQKIAQETNDEILKTLAKKIIAVPPQVKTNLYELRREAVMSLVRAALEDAPPIAEVDAITVPGTAIALFDPERVIDGLTKGGRLRKDVERVKAGDIIWFGVDGAGPAKLHLVRALPPPAQPVLDLRLRVTSGVVFIGPPESADGPRLGELRLDPFSTQLHAYAKSGRMVRMKPGRYIVAGHRLDAGEIQLYVSPASEAEPPPPLADLTPLGLLPPLSALPSA
jgi:hypothetical protein